MSNKTQYRYTDLEIEGMLVPRCDMDDIVFIYHAVRIICQLLNDNQDLRQENKALRDMADNLGDNLSLSDWIKQQDSPPWGF